MRSFALSGGARGDLAHIHAEGIRQFGENQADSYFNSLIEKFDLIASQPKAFRLRDNIQPAVRICPHGRHLIIYEIDRNDDVYVLRIRHGRENWQEDKG